MTRRRRVVAAATRIVVVVEAVTMLLLHLEHAACQPLALRDRRERVLVGTLHRAKHAGLVLAAEVVPGPHGPCAVRGGSRPHAAAATRRPRGTTTGHADALARAAKHGTHEESRPRPGAA
jgi:hypothetical protein